MSDPHVDILRYRITTGGGISYKGPASLCFSNHLGNFRTKDDHLEIEPSEHFATVGDARDAIEPFLKGWEIDADLKRNVGMLRFIFETAGVVDRAPPPPGSPQVIHVEGISHIHISATASLHLTCIKYPEPPSQFSATPDVLYAYRRWLAFHDGREPLPATAYFILTIAERSAGGRREAAQTYRIDAEVLRKVGELSSTRGSEMTARKADSQRQYHDLSPDEESWLQQALRMLIQRLGEHASGAATLSQITLADLPSL